MRAWWLAGRLALLAGCLALPGTDPALPRSLGGRYSGGSLSKAGDTGGKAKTEEAVGEESHWETSSPHFVGVLSFVIFAYILIFFVGFTVYFVTVSAKQNAAGEIHWDSLEKVPWDDVLGDTQCMVCLDCFTGVALALPCGHVLHGECGYGWFKQKKWCPLCRQAVPGGVGGCGWTSPTDLKEPQPEVPPSALHRLRLRLCGCSKLTSACTRGGRVAQESASPRSPRQMRECSTLLWLARFCALAAAGCGGASILGIAMQE